MPPIPGEAGVDFPVLTSVPETSFDCGFQEFPGIYGDTEARCQVIIIPSFFNIGQYMNFKMVYFLKAKPSHINWYMKPL